jgi:hypothetical protein
MQQEKRAVAALIDEPHSWGRVTLDWTWMRGAYALTCMATVLLSAFLLFQVQPIMGKVILPWFGGTPAVWMSCMLFFQVMLLVGYAYSHLIAVRLSPLVQGLVHLGLLALVLSQLPLTISESWKPAANGNPSWQILVVLLQSVGLPFLALSSTGPLIQSWFSKMLPGRSYYRLYALSNGGSFLALLSYPFLIEPVLRLRVQTEFWSVGVFLFAIACAACAAGVVVAGRRNRGTPAEPLLQSHTEVDGAKSGEDGPTTTPRALDLLLWIGLAACGSTMLLAITNQLCQNVAAVPLLWVVPLAIYLLSFVLCFDHPRWYARNVFAVAFAVVLVGSLLLLLGPELGLAIQVVIYMAMLFVCCMCCHGELYQLRPAARHLTLFFLMVSAGGAIGGLFVSLIAPVLFKLLLELPLGLLGTAILFIVARRRNSLQAFVERRGSRGLLLLGGGFAGGCLLLGVLGSSLAEIAFRNSGTLSLTRNFYGTLRVATSHREDPEKKSLELTHGTTVHGAQFVHPDKRLQPTTYYGPGSGASVALDQLRSKVRPEGRLHVAVVGLGVGTVAVYAAEGDRFRFYEINPDVAEQADEYFTYLEDARGRGAQVDIELGDGRKVLERQLAQDGPQEFDVLIVDAFSSDAIPVHLLTIEVFELYWRHLRSNGVLAIHVSNNFLDLSPLVAGLAARSGKSTRRIDSPPDPELGTHLSNWVIVADESVLEAVAVDGESKVAKLSGSSDLPVWTDDYSSLLPLLK